MWGWAVMMSWMSVDDEGLYISPWRAGVSFEDEDRGLWRGADDDDDMGDVELYPLPLSPPSLLLG